MAKTIFYYRMNLYKINNTHEVLLSISERQKVLKEYMKSLRSEREDEVAITKFNSRANDKTIYFEVIDDPIKEKNDEKYLFGLIGQKAGKNYHLRNETTSRSTDIPLLSDQSLEAATLFLFDLDSMVCTFVKETSGPAIEELNGLFMGYKNFGDYRIKMVPIPNENPLEAVVAKQFINKIGYEVEVPQEEFFEMLDIDFGESNELINKGYAVLRFELKSDTSSKSLLKDIDADEKTSLLKRVVKAVKDKAFPGSLKSPRVYSTAKNTGEILQDYSFLSEQMNVISKYDFTASRLQKFSDEHPLYKGRISFFMFTKKVLLEKLKEVNSMDRIPVKK